MMHLLTILEPVRSVHALVLCSSTVTHEDVV